MGFFGGAKKITIATGKGMWKAGAYLTVVGGKSAGKGSVWVLKKVAVDPVSRKITDTKLVTNGGKLIEAVKRDGRCAECNKSFNSKGGKFHYCGIDCSTKAAYRWNRYERKTIAAEPVTATDIHLNCGCNSKNLFHGPNCKLGMHNHRVADNIKWSNRNPDYMKPAPQRDKKRQEELEQRLAAQKGRKQPTARDIADAKKMLEKNRWGLF